MKPSEETKTKVRLTLDLSAKLNELLDDIADEAGVTKSEVLRSAIHMLATARQARKEGMKVGAWKEQDETITRVREFIAAI